MSQMLGRGETKRRLEQGFLHGEGGKETLAFEQGTNKEKTCLGSIAIIYNITTVRPYFDAAFRHIASQFN